MSPVDKKTIVKNVYLTKFDSAPRRSLCRSLVETADKELRESSNCIILSKSDVLSDAMSKARLCLAGYWWLWLWLWMSRARQNKKSSHLRSLESRVGCSPGFRKRQNSLTIIKAEEFLLQTGKVNESALEIYNFSITARKCLAHHEINCSSPINKARFCYFQP